MKYRWSKGKKDKNTLPNGNKIIFLTVGGRTSAVVPEVQKKTGPVSADIPADAITKHEKSKEVAKNVGSTKMKKSEDKKRTASAASMSTRLPNGKKQRSNDVTKFEVADIAAMKRELRQELKQELKDELKHELIQEMKKDLQHYVKQSQESLAVSKTPSLQTAPTVENSLQDENDIPNGSAANGKSRRRSARLKG